MLRTPLRSGSLRGVRCALAVLAVALGACAGMRSGPAAPPLSPAEAYRAVLGRNAGLSTVRAVAETRISYAGHQITMPGVLQLNALGNFQLDLLDPLGQPAAILYAERDRIVQYRPAQQLGASLGVFPEECRGVDSDDWVAVVLAAAASLPAGDRLVDGPVWFADRWLERYSGGELRQAVRYRRRKDGTLPISSSWYCGEDAVMRLQFLEWVGDGRWRLPSRLEIEYPKAGLNVRVELREVEGNPLPPPPGPGLPQPGSSSARWTRWTIRDLPR